MRGTRTTSVTPHRRPGGLRPARRLQQGSRHQLRPVPEGQHPQRIAAVHQDAAQGRQEHHGPRRRRHPGAGRHLLLHPSQQRHHRQRPETGTPPRTRRPGPGPHQLSAPPPQGVHSHPTTGHPSRRPPCPTSHRARRPRRRLAALATATLAAAATATVLILSGGTPPERSSSPIHVTATVNIRPTPDTSQPPLGTIPQGASPDFHCFTYGQNINGVNVWFNISWAGHTGYYASYYELALLHRGAADRDLRHPQMRRTRPRPRPGARRCLGRREPTRRSGGRVRAPAQHRLRRLLPGRGLPGLPAAGVNITAGLPYTPAHTNAYTYWTVARNRTPATYNRPAARWFLPLRRRAARPRRDQPGRRADDQHL